MTCCKCDCHHDAKPENKACKLDCEPQSGAWAPNLGNKTSPLNMATHPAVANVYELLTAERRRQDALWGGAHNDDCHTAEH